MPTTFAIAAACWLTACSNGESPQATRSPEPPAATPVAPPLPASRLTADALRGAPTQRLADGHPDFNGTWQHAGGGVLNLDYVSPETLPDGSVCLFGCAGGETRDDAAEEEFVEPEAPFSAPEPTFPSYQPAYQQQVDELRESQVETDTVLRCFPPGVPRIGPPGKIVQTATELVLLYNDYTGGYFRIVPLGASRGEQPPSQLGQAVGRFEGDVLVIETTRLTTDTWLTDNGAFHTADLRVVERLSRIGDTIDYEAVAHDPAVLTEPWVARTQTLWLSAEELDVPVPCEDRDLPFMQDRSYHENPR